MKVENQQNSKTPLIAVLIISDPSNNIDDLLPPVPAVLRRLATLTPRSIARVP